MNEWMNEFIRLTEMTINQAEKPRHDKCVRLPVSWLTINNWLRIVKTNITNRAVYGYKT